MKCVIDELPEKYKYIINLEIRSPIIEKVKAVGDEHWYSMVFGSFNQMLHFDLLNYCSYHKQNINETKSSEKMSPPPAQSETIRFIW